VRNVARDKILESLDSPTDPVHISSLLRFTWANNTYDVATEIYRYLLPLPANTLSRSYNVRLFKQLIDFLAFMPSLVIYFARISPWNTLPESARQILVESVPKLLKALIMSANSMESLIVKYLSAVLEEADILTLTLIQDLTEMVALVVSSPEVALDIFLEGLEPLSTHLIVQNPRTTQYLLRNLFGIALDHIDESNESSKTGKYPWKFEAQRDGNGEVTLLTCQRRIDAPQLERLATGDHVRFLSASEPVNTFLTKPAMFEAMVESAQTGEVKFRCLRQPPVFVEDCFWKLKHCGSFITAKTMSDAVVRLLVEKNECCGVFSRLMISALSNISIEPKAILQRDRNDLNPSQSQAVSAALSGPLACLWGPPGTGKTYTIVTFLQELLQSEPTERVLVTAPTHNAVDNVIRKFVKRRGQGSTQLPLPLRVSTDVRYGTKYLSYSPADIF
jgi:AAA domain